MKHIKLFSRIPRPIRAIINLVLVMVLAAVFYISIGSPVLTFRQEFRRAEKAHLIGKSKIVDQITDYQDYDKMIVGETEQGICFFGQFDVIVSRNQHENRYTLTYYEKTEDVTVAIAPNITGRFWDLAGYDLPIYVFHAYPEAHRAEIEMEVANPPAENPSGQSFLVVYKEILTAEANKSNDGHFRFMLTSNDENSAKALALLSIVASGENIGPNEENVVIPVTVRLYDAQNQLILEKKLEIHQ